MKEPPRVMSPCAFCLLHRSAHDRTQLLRHAPLRWEMADGAHLILRVRAAPSRLRVRVMQVVMGGCGGGVIDGGVEMWTGFASFVAGQGVAVLGPQLRRQSMVLMRSCLGCCLNGVGFGRGKASGEGLP